MAESFDKRLARLERAGWGDSADLADVEREFWEAVRAHASAFEGGDEQLSLERRMKFELVRHLGWQQRFQPEASAESVMALYEVQPPDTILGWILARSFVPGDHTL